MDEPLKISEQPSAGGATLPPLSLPQAAEGRKEIAVPTIAELTKSLQAQPTEDPTRFTQTTDVIAGEMVDAYGAPALHGLNSHFVPIYEEELVAAQLGVSIQKFKELKKAFDILRGYPHVKRVLVFRCALTGDPRVFFVSHQDRVGDIVDRWIRFMPEEAEAFRIQMAERRKLMDNDRGMSAGRTMKAKGEIPDNVYWAIRELDPDFWKKPEDYTRFFDEYPYFKPTGG